VVDRLCIRGRLPITAIGPQTQENDLLSGGLDDPVFGNARLFIQTPLDDQVLLSAAFQRDLKGQRRRPVQIILVQVYQTGTVYEQQVRRQSMLSQANDETPA